MLSKDINRLMVKENVNNPKETNINTISESKSII